MEISFERYNIQAKRIIFFAHSEANQFGAPAVEPEHVMLGLAHEKLRLLDRFSTRAISLQQFRKEIEARTLLRETFDLNYRLPLAPETKSVLDYASKECDRLGHSRIAAEHLLLGLMLEERSMAAEILYESGIRLRAVQEAIQSEFSDEISLATDLDPHHEFIAMALVGDTIRLVSLAPDGEYRFLEEAYDIHVFIHVDSLETSIWQRAIEELEDLVNNPEADERDFQDFFTRNKEFILNDEYKDAHPHIALKNDQGECLVPDFVLEPIDQNGLCDLLELKLPSTPIFNLKKNRQRYSAAVAEACAQLREYGRYFEEERNRDFALANYGLTAYRPKMFVIIGRRGTVAPIEQRCMESDFSNLYLRTYDDIISRMKWKVERLKRGGSH